MLKGIKGGILIDITDIDKNIEELDEKLRNSDFFGRNLDFYLSEKDKKHYKKILEVIDKYNHNLYIYKEIPEIKVEKKEVFKTVEKQEYKKIEREEKGGTLIIKKTLRSGQRIDYEGNVIIIGDVNPGAEVAATGDIYIFGRARGILHAGKSGDISREILALSMEVNQLRIANIFANGDGEKPEGRVAERAFLDENKHLILEEYKWI